MCDSQTAKIDDSCEDVAQIQALKSSSELSGSTLQDEISKVSIKDVPCPKKPADLENPQGLTRCGELLSLRFTWSKSEITLVAGEVVWKLEAEDRFTAAGGRGAYICFSLLSLSNPPSDCLLKFEIMSS
jgi:hypothetical protein